jgi:hypothetical protein
VGIVVVVLCQPLDLDGMMRAAFIVIALSIAFATSAGLAEIQDKPAPVPTLTTEQQKDIKIKVQEMTIAQLQFDKSRTELAALLQSLQKDGYDIDLHDVDHAAYVKKTAK